MSTSVVKTDIFLRAHRLFHYRGTTRQAVVDADVFDTVSGAGLLGVIGAKVALNGD
jgi:hypothetical protein